MPSAEIQILRCTDRELIDCLCRFRDENGKASSFKVTFTYLSSGSEAFEVSSVDLSTSEKLSICRESACRIFQSVRVDCQPLGEFRIQRHHGSQQNTDNREAFDSISISTPDNQPNRDGAADRLGLLVSFVQTAFGRLPTTSLADFVGESARQHFEARDTALARLESLVAKYTGDLEDARKRQDDILVQKQQGLDADFKSKEVGLAVRLEAGDAELKKRATDLDARAKSLNLQEPKTERRRVFDELNTTLGEWDKSFKLSDGPATRRWPTHALMIVLLVFCACWAAYFLSRAMATGQPTSELVFFYVRAGVFLVLAVSFATYYLRWMSAWQHKHADEEFRLKRMQLDLKRAHWFVELAFQWKDEFKESVPAEMVDRLTRHLFEEAAAEAKPKTKLDSLAASLLGAGSKLTVSPTGPQLEIGSPGLKALAKEILREMNAK